MIPYLNSQISYFARTNFRSDGALFGIYQHDRLMHTYIIGKTGTGKTNLLTTLILQDIINHRGCGVFDVHGDLLTDVLKNLPSRRLIDVIFLDLTNPDLNYRYNPLKKVSYEKRSLVASGVLESFKKLWSGAWGVKLEHILRYILLTLLDQPKATLADVPRILNEDTFRSNCIEHIVAREVKEFWNREFPKYTKNDLVPILNKVGAFLAHPAIKRFLITNDEELSLRSCMDQSKIILVNISKGILGMDVAHLVGSLLLTSFAHAAFSRTDTPENERKPFHIFLDEFHNYTSPSITEMLSELRKFKVSLTLAHQYLGQLDTDIRNAVLGNVGTVIAFRLGQSDATYLARECHPIFDQSDFTNLQNFDIYLKLMINGKPSKAFSATTIPYVKILSPPW